MRRRPAVYNIIKILFFFNYYIIRVYLTRFFMRRTTEKISESTYSFVANVSDHSVRVRCEAKNSISLVPQYDDIELSVICKCDFFFFSIFSPRDRQINIVTIFVELNPANKPLENCHYGHITMIIVFLLYTYSLYYQREKKC